MVNHSIPPFHTGLAQNLLCLIRREFGRKFFNNLGEKTMHTDLNEWGLERHSINIDPNNSFEKGRILVQHNEDYRLISKSGVLPATLMGKLRFSADSAADIPCVGDWVYGIATEDIFVIQGVFPRRTKLSRKRPGKEEEQLIVSNIDILFLVQGLDENFNERRMERLL